MATKTSEQLIKEQIESLPRAVREAIASFDWARIVFDIGRKNNLQVDDIGEIQKEVMLVVLGLISPKEFYDQMVERVGIVEDKAFNIADEVNEKVFVRIREYMKNYYEEQEEVQSERRVLNSAGIRFDDGEDLPEEAIKTKPAVENKKTEEEIIVPPPQNANSNIKEEVQEKKTEKQFKDLPETPPNFLDPYREPIE